MFVETRVCEVDEMILYKQLCPGLMTGEISAGFIYTTLSWSHDSTGLTTGEISAGFI